MHEFIKNFANHLCRHEVAGHTPPVSELFRAAFLSMKITDEDEEKNSNRRRGSIH
jgi:hypothetical protein